MLKRSEASPGALVECIDDRARVRGFPLVRGGVYRIRGVIDKPGRYFPGWRRGVPCPFGLILEGVKQPMGSARFRLVDDRKLDVFRAMLRMKA
jgi:hypothetical protein